MQILFYSMYCYLNSIFDQKYFEFDKNALEFIA